MTDVPFAEVTKTLKQLRLPAFVEALEHLYEKDVKRALTVAAELATMAEHELARRTSNSIERRIKNAQFVRIQTVDVFDFNYCPSTRKIRKRYLQMIHADHVKQDVGAIFVGNSGLGKTHLARALGYAACQRQHRVLFLPCSTLLNRLVTAEATKDLGREIKKLEAPSLLIIDEVAYMTMSHDEANLFYQVVSRRHDNCRPTVATTNAPFSEWNQVFHGDATAHAIIDRLTEKAEIFYLEGKSYRETHRKGIESAAHNDVR
jgi:DNA replication protein DnaC